MASPEGLAERSAPLLPPGSAVRHAFVCQTAPHFGFFIVNWATGLATPWIKYRCVTVTDDAIYVLDSPRLSGAQDPLRSSLSCRVALDSGRCRDRRWGEITLLGKLSLGEKAVPRGGHCGRRRSRPHWLTATEDQKTSSTAQLIWAGGGRRALPSENRPYRRLGNLAQLTNAEQNGGRTAVSGVPGRAAQNHAPHDVDRLGGAAPNRRSAPADRRLGRDPGVTHGKARPGATGGPPRAGSGRLQRRAAR